MPNKTITAEAAAALLHSGDTSPRRALLAPEKRLKSISARFVQMAQSSELSLFFAAGRATANNEPRKLVTTAVA